ncbi:MAG: YggS family pyridoxal phosphate-dependent enzyme [Alphaproteobacteria bacterium]|nr:YggS family pyridoxal phosphate-dependent enzyme [Alphaproteobacteria bacterium]
MDSQALIERYQSVRDRIAAAAREAGRDPASIRLVIASKTQPAEAIELLLEAGHRHFGENRVQEAQAKWPALRERYRDIELHLIGPLQTNKAREALALFDVIETVDRQRLAEVLGKEIQRLERPPQFYVEVNTGQEPQKAGIMPAEADRFIGYCREPCGLAIKGLMCIPPAGEQASPHFALLNVIAKRNGLEMLSMGMTADFQLAIQLGATHVRVGTAIFGARAPV